MDAPEPSFIRAGVFVDSWIDLRTARWVGCHFDGCVLIGDLSALVEGSQIHDCLVVSSPRQAFDRSLWVEQHKRAQAIKPIRDPLPPPR